MNVDRVWVRNTAISAAIACGAMVAGPGVSGTAVASADLLGVGVDVLGIFGHHKDNKKSSNHRAGANGKQNDSSAKTGRPGSQKTVKPGQADNKPGQADKRKTGLGGESSDQKSAGNTEGTTNRAAQSANTPSTLSAGSAPSTLSAGVGVAEASVSVPQVQVSIPSTGGGGGGGAATSGRIGRAPNLAPVPTAPSSRQIVIHAQPAEAPSAPRHAAPEAAPPSIAAPSAPVVAAPVPPVAPPDMIVLPLPPLPEVAPAAPSGGGGAHAAPPAVPSAPQVTAPTAQPPQHVTSPINAIPETFRVGYADYLRVSTTTDLVFAVLPGLAGMVLLTAAGGAVGFRQARAARTLPSPQIARFLP
ncbi:hypothetical protein H7J55_27805 [Mycolicibacterium brisbanense]|nr:hypothetical protein [Mycolicibacterium brisbanense]